MKFKVGDKVTVIYEKSLFAGQTGVIVKCTDPKIDPDVFEIEFDNAFVTHLYHKTHLKLATPKFKIGDIVGSKIDLTFRCLKIEKIILNEVPKEFYLKFTDIPITYPEKDFELLPKPTQFVTIKNGDGQIFKLTPQNTFLNKTTSVYLLNNKFFSENDLEKVKIKNEFDALWTIQSVTESTVKLETLVGEHPIENLALPQPKKRTKLQISINLIKE